MADAGVMSFVSSKAIWDASPDGLLLVDHEGTICATNGPLDDLFGYEPDELVGITIERLVPPAARDRHVADRNAFTDAPRSRAMGASRALEGLRSDGTTFPVNVSLFSVETELGPMVVAAVRDLSDRIRSEQELATIHRLKAVAEDHDRIARELHDTVIQRLFVVGLGLQSFASQLPGESETTRLLDAVDSIDEIIRDIRNSIFGLQEPNGRTGASLRQDVIDVVNEMETSLGFAPEVRFSGPVDAVDRHLVADHLRAVIREALSNTARHADATAAVVTVVAAGDRLRVEVTDNGIGIPHVQGRSGLRNLEDRAIALNGSFSIARRPEGGTHLAWSVPVD